ncbi:sulfite exporter TauE/SafE family protein [Hydrogenibacillus sp. N12]|uniref:sulfite exporter TauE/SafE family protein n=1 Tax=Hydrogenibacillus sp. N12 TaxID=2866627 RepID=UPI001C7CB720|nr:sulfite exporter TauE/SafE family protein [Hydrogenibacillus sp. N12]QZA32817.1 sulfite exporter TauE/SafE family protein [Hydrogenibacillus sp. N12]
MTLGLGVTLFLIGFVGSFISGLVGIGGSIVKYPMLLYIPPLLGVGSFTAHEVSGISAVQVFFATLSGVFALRKEKVLNKPLIATMGLAIIIGSFVGAFGGKFLSGDAINFVYAVLATIAAVMMFVPKKGLDDVPLEQVTFSRPLAAVSAFLVGVASGIVGAAGAFILVPVMLLVLKIPTRMTIATSLAVTFISSIGSTVGKVLAGDVLFWPSVIMIVASVLAAPIGARLSTKVNTKVLQGILAVLIVATAVKIWSDMLF